MAQNLLIPLVDNVVAALNASVDESWNDLSIGTEDTDYMRAEPAIDPENMFESETRKLYILPITSTINKGESSGRGPKVISINRRPMIAVVMVVPFQEIDPDGTDVAPWSEVSKLISLREDIDVFLTKQDFGHNLIDVNPEPAQEILLKGRKFVAVTDFEYEAMGC